MRLGALAGSFTFSGTAQCLLVNFTDELKQLEVNNYCWSSVCASGASSVSRSGDAPHATRAAEVLLIPGGEAGCPPTQHPVLAAAPVELGPPVPAGLHRLCPPALAATTDTCPQASPFFSPFFFFLPFFPPFFLRATEAEWPEGSPTQSVHRHMCTLSPDLHLSLLVHAHVWPCNVHFPVCLPIIFYITSGELVPEESRRRSC